MVPLTLHADLSDLKVYSPLVEKGHMGIEVLGNTTFDGENELGGSQYHEFELEYGVTEWWASSITNSLKKAADGPLKYNVFGWENTFQLTEKNKYWLDFGIHIELEFDDEMDESDQVEIRFMFRKEVNNIEHILNLNFEQQFGSQADESLELEYIWRSKIRVTENMDLGFEAYGALGEIKSFEALHEHEHIFGPAFYYEFKLGEIEIESHFVWLFGLTAASADDTLRWQLEFEF
ncbi:MAG: hypothetical protein ACI9SC_001904 [Gammaproteobacteria bacterium]|jgi:hypothetical protein